MAEQIGRRLGDRHQQVRRALRSRSPRRVTNPAAASGHDPDDRRAPRQQLVHPSQRAPGHRPALGGGVGQPAERPAECPRVAERHVALSPPRPSGARAVRADARSIAPARSSQPTRSGEAAQQVARHALGGDLGVDEVEQAVVADEDEGRRTPGSWREYKGQMGR